MSHSGMPAPGRGGFPACRSILFVPGDRPERFDKAMASGADAVCIDLEDAVAPERKDGAREAVARFLRGRRADPSTLMPVIVRVNEMGGGRDHMMHREGERDATALEGCPPPDAIMVPKVRTAADVEIAARHLPATALIPLIETVQGLENAAGIAGGAAVCALVFGGFDLAIELGAEPRWESLLLARSHVVHAAALGSVQAIDMPSRDFREMTGLRREAAGARALGFAGKAAVHPAQIPVIHEVFTPSPEEVRRAREIVEADRAAGGSAVALDGRMVDRPVVEAARRVMQRARVAKPPAAPPRAAKPPPAQARVATDLLSPWPCRAMLGLLDRDPDTLADGDPLPLGWHWFYFRQFLRASRIGTDGHEERGNFMPRVDLAGRMWAGGTLRSLHPVLLGEPAELRSEIRGVDEKRGKSGRLVFVTIGHSVLQDGRECVEEEQVIVYREAGGSRPPDSPGAESVPPPAWRETFLPTTTALFQFSALTYNAHRIHYDHPYVTEQEGYPGLLVHGPLTALLLLDAAARHAPAPPHSFRYRALAPLYADAPITLVGRSRAPSGGPADAQPPDPATDQRIVEALGPGGVVAMRGWVA